MQMVTVAPESSNVPFFRRIGNIMSRLDHPLSYISWLNQATISRWASVSAF